MNNKNYNTKCFCAGKFNDFRNKSNARNELIGYDNDNDMNDIEKLESRMNGIEKSINELKSLISDYCNNDKKVDCRCDEDAGSRAAYLRSLTTNDIMENFNFDRVVDVMEHLEWTWYDGEGSSVPDVDRIREMAEDLLSKAWGGLDNEAPVDGDGWREWQVSTGGFTAWVCENANDPDERYAKLSFNVEEWSVEPGDFDGCTKPEKD